MNASLLAGLAPITKRVVPFVAAVAIGGAGLGYAVHEHRAAEVSAMQAQTLSTQNKQMATELSATNYQVDSLVARVNTLETSKQAKPSPAVRGGEAAHSSGIRGRRIGVEDSRFNKLQSQVDAQGKEIAQTENDLAGTRTELTGSIARTHDELVTLEKKGERKYFEFDLVSSGPWFMRSKQWKREGPLSMSLNKANVRHQYADLSLMVDDRDLTQKHVNLYQPVMYYGPDNHQPVEIVINAISKDHIHGYVSAPKYQASELAALSVDQPDNGAVSSQLASGQQPQLHQRQKLSISDNDIVQASGTNQQ